VAAAWTHQDLDHDRHEPTLAVRRRSGRDADQGRTLGGPSRTVTAVRPLARARSRLAVTTPLGARRGKWRRSAEGVTGLYSRFLGPHSVGGWETGAASARSGPTQPLPRRK
jgi:hypothetical protein